MDILPVFCCECFILRCCVLGQQHYKSALNKLNKLIRKADSVAGVKLDSLEVVAEQRTLSKLLAILDNTSHPLHATLEKQKGTFSGRLLQLRSVKEPHVRSFLPIAIRLYNESPFCRDATDLLLSELC